MNCKRGIHVHSVGDYISISPTYSRTFYGQREGLVQVITMIVRYSNIILENVHLNEASLQHEHDISVLHVLPYPMSMYLNQMYWVPFEYLFQHTGSVYGFVLWGREVLGQL